MRRLTEVQLRGLMSRFLLQSRSFLQLASSYIGLPAEMLTQSDHSFAAPPNPNPPGWCVCGRCSEMPTARENVCCGERECTSAQEYFRSTVLDPDVLQLNIRYRADFFNLQPDYRPASYRKAAYRQYVLGRYGYLGRGIRRVVPSCSVRCIRFWYPSPVGDYMGYRSD